ncbi:hypothetical protein PN498_23515 [Oscillatoria sp. CS-180]|nr:hypothetical protein [Oscillatoria sp. CS-180]
MFTGAVQASPLQTDEATSNPLLEATEIVRPIDDGIYVYGSAPEADQVGAGYLVFEAQGSSVIGAIYMPQSSFDCFQGTVSGNELALQITNSYTQEVYDYDIALVSTEEPIASTEAVEFPLQLEGFFDLGTADESNRELLAICQADLLSPEMEL